MKLPASILQVTVFATVLACSVALPLALALGMAVVTFRWVTGSCV